MTDFLALAGAVAAGGVVGTGFFVGLWATVRALPAARRPALLVLGSLIARFGIAAALFVLLARRGGWAWTLSALAGFVLARMVVVRGLLGPGPPTSREAP